MAVIYLFDAQKRLKRPIRQLEDLVHHEGDYKAEAYMSAVEAVEYGDFFGFRCADNRFRLFLVTANEVQDDKRLRTISGPDAALAELDGLVLERLSLTDTTVGAATAAALDGSGWQVGRLNGGGEVKTEDAYFATRWAALKTIAAAGRVRMVPYYEFTGGEITAKKVDVLEKAAVFNGLIYTRQKGAANIRITKEGAPKGRVYGIGKVIGSGEPPEQLTFADVVWSTANGDPADKPAGQTWVELPGAASQDGYVFEDKTETDPKKLLKKSFEDLEKRQRPTVSGTANLTDMDWVPGYEHRTVHVWDVIAVRTAGGDAMETTVLGIERHHVRRDLTKIKIGDESEDSGLTSQVARLQITAVDAARRAGGAGAGAGEAKRMILSAEELIQLNAKRIEANAEEIQLKATTTRVDELENDTLVNFRETQLLLDETSARLTATNNVVNNLENTATRLETELYLLDSEIGLKASKSELDELGNRVTTSEAELKLIPGKLEAKADLILLEGYVKASELEAEVAKINAIFTGNANAENIYVNQTIGAQWGIFTNVELINRPCRWNTVTMGDVASADVLSYSRSGELNLQHSHAVIVNDDGTVTFGEVSSSGGSFRIADTKAYKEGVSAAYDNGKTDWSPADIERVSYSMEDKTVTVRAVNAAGVPVIMGDVEAGEIYSAGAVEVGIETQGWYGPENTIVLTNGKRFDVELPTLTMSQAAWNGTSKNVALVMTDDSGTAIALGAITVDAYSVREAAWNEAYPLGYNAGKADWAPDSIARSAYDAKAQTVTVRALNAAGVPVIMGTVSAAEIYNAGWADAGDSIALGFDNSSVTLTDLGDNVYQMRLTIYANVGGVRKASKTIYVTKGIY